MARAIDHLVIASHDLDALAGLYRRLGFQVGSRNRHPWGTENHIVQFDGAFLELIGLGQGYRAPEPEKGVFSFGGFVGGFLARREGLAMLALRSADAEADRQRFAAEGLGAFRRFDFTRKARRPEGSEVDVGFSLAFAVSDVLPEAGFFVCAQKYPENFWSRAAQIHPNGAIGIAGVSVVIEKPKEAAEFLARLFEASPPRTLDGGYAVSVDGAELECLTRPAFEERFGGELIPAEGAPLALARMRVADAALLSRRLEADGVPHHRIGNAVAVNARDAAGLAVVFETR
jgi:hypothetical protein